MKTLFYCNCRWLLQLFLKCTCMSVLNLMACASSLMLLQKINSVLLSSHINSELYCCTSISNVTELLRGITMISNHMLVSLSRQICLTSLSASKLWMLDFRKTFMPPCFKFWRLAVIELPTCTALSVAIYTESLASFNELPMHTYSKSLIQSALRIATPQDRYSAVFRAGEGKEFRYFDSAKWFMPRFLSGIFFPPCKDHFPWLHLTTGTILSIGSLIQSDWIHCSAVLMDVLWSFLSLNSHLNPLFNLRFEFPPKNGAPLSSER